MLEFSFYFVVCFFLGAVLTEAAAGYVVKQPPQWPRVKLTSMPIVRIQTCALFIASDVLSPVQV